MVRGVSKNGRKPPEQEEVKFSVSSCPASLLEAVDADAEKFHRSRAAQVISILTGHYQLAATEKLGQ